MSSVTTKTNGEQTMSTAELEKKQVIEIEGVENPERLTKEYALEHAVRIQDSRFGDLCNTVCISKVIGVPVKEIEELMEKLTEGEAPVEFTFFMFSVHTYDVAEAPDVPFFDYVMLSVLLEWFGNKCPNPIPEAQEKYEKTKKALKLAQLQAMEQSVNEA